VYPGSSEDLTTALKRGSRDWVGRKGLAPKATAGNTLVRRKKTTKADMNVTSVIMPLITIYLLSDMQPPIQVTYWRLNIEIEIHK
jgi:hypothetical protein